MANVLLVDDDPAFVEATAKIIAVLGHTVNTANSIKEAKTRLENASYDRIFLDLMLPDGSGFHLLEHIPSGNTDTKVTIITGHPSVKNHVMSV
ncbi:MAG: response regulator, partial [Pseudohongiellaceae bacterium]